MYIVVSSMHQIHPNQIVGMDIYRNPIEAKDAHLYEFYKFTKSTLPPILKLKNPPPPFVKTDRFGRALA